MTNPFQLYTTELLQALIKSGHKYFVRQTYKRGIDHFDNGAKKAFLISHYNDISKAKMHHEALTLDGNRFLYDVSNGENLDKLKIAAAQPVGYKIYTPMLSNPWVPSDVMKGKVKRYIDQKLKWSLGRNDTVRTNLFTQFGELFITLKLGINEIEIPLSEVERL